MAYRHLHFTSLAKDLNLRTEIYNGEEHLVVPCVALVGDEVVYGMNAEGPEFIPAEELEFSTLGWSGRPVLPDHPANSTATANDPHTLQVMQFGQIFYPRFEDKKLKVEAWLGKERAKKVTGAVEIIEKVESGEVIELSVGAIISLERKNGVSPSGKPYQAIWHDVQSDHLAIGLNGSQGACNLEMGCGANRTLSCGASNLDSNDVRMMRAERATQEGGNKVPESNDKPAVTGSAQPVVKPQSKIQKVLSFASRIFRPLVEDEGLSDFDLRSKLWDILYSIEPAFNGIEDVFQESKTVRYITNPTFPDNKMFLWRRTFDVAEDETVTVNDDREEVDFAVNYIYLANGERKLADKPPCGCHDTNAQPETQTLSAQENDSMADAPKTEPSTPNTPATPTTPTTPTTPATPPEAPAAPATEDTNPEGTVPAVTNEQLKALLEAHPVVKHYRAQEAKEKSSLVSALAKKQTVLSKEQLEAKPIEELRTIAELIGVGSVPVQGQPDFSGRMMASGEEDQEERPVPKPWSQALKKGKSKDTDQEAN